MWFRQLVSYPLADVVETVKLKAGSAGVKRHGAAFFVAATTLSAGVFPAIVALHMMVN